MTLKYIQHAYKGDRKLTLLKTMKYYTEEIVNDIPFIPCLVLLNSNLTIAMA